METKISISFGGIQVNYEGDDDYLNDGLLELLEAVIGMQKGWPVSTFVNPEEEEGGKTAATGVPEKFDRAGNILPRGSNTNTDAGGSGNTSPITDVRTTIKKPKKPNVVYKPGSTVNPKR